MTNQPSLTSSFALDVQGVNGLKKLSKNDSEAGVTEAAKQFEALFISKLLKSAREATPKSGLISSEQTDIYNDLYDQQMGQAIAGKGIGLAEQIAADMRRKGLIDGSPDEYTEKLIAGIPRGTPKLLTDSVPLNGSSSPMRSAEARPIEKAFKLLESGADRPAHVASFVSNLGDKALATSAKSGVPAELILAQAALETGWGKHQIRTDNGKESFNLFGIKAGAHWTGKTASVVTTEYVDGSPVKSVEKFRAYGSYQEAFDDYGRLLAGSPRYKKVLAAATPQSAAYALQSGGYATDPKYASKLVAVMDTMGPIQAKQRVSVDSIFGSAPTAISNGTALAQK